jgi:hypothetical protein
MRGYSLSLTATGPPPPQAESRFTRAVASARDFCRLASGQLSANDTADGHCPRERTGVEGARESEKHTLAAGRGA